jgi:hypothetical protein
VLEVLREAPALTQALALLRALERAGRAQPGAQLVGACAPAVADAVRPYESALADRLGRRFEIAARDGWPLERLEVIAR